MKHIFVVCLGILFSCALSFADATDPRDLPLNPYITLDATPASAGIVIDGLLEEVWYECARFENFAEFMPTHQVPAKAPTEGYVTYDASSLYVAFVCYDPDMEKLRASVTDRDHMYQDDFVGVILDTDRDQQRAYEFFSNPHGVQGDMLWNANRSDDDDGGAIWQANGGEDESFDAVWESEGKIYEDKWVVEMKIPFSNLRYPDQPGQNWAVHFVRVYPRENRYQFSWMPISQDNNSFMGQAGGLELDLDESSGSNRSFEIMPYVAGSKTDRLVDDGTGKGIWRSQDDGRIQATERIGFTGKYALSTSHMLDFAYKPDFSQIESDAGRIDVNTPWAFFYPERRPFFMEGSDVFQVDYVSSGMILDVANLIYTRSINDPKVAAKITGKMGKLSYGYISAYDENTPLILPLADGTIVRNTEESSWSNILRLKYDVGKQVHLGLAATNRRLDVGGSNTAVALETNLRLTDDYTITAFGALTYTDEPDDDALSAIIPDATFEVDDRSITADFDGQHFQGRVFKTTVMRQSRHWNFNVSYQDYSPGFRADNSAIFSNDGRLLHTFHTYNFHFDDHPLFTLIRPSVYLWRKTDYEGDVKDTGIRPQLLFSFQHQTTLNIGGFLYNREKFGGVEFDDARTLWAYLGTQAFEKISGGVFVNNGESINRFGEPGSEHNPLALVPTFELNAEVTARPTDKTTNTLTYDSTRLRTSNGRKLIVRQQIIRNSFQYQFSKRAYIRLIAELNLLKRAVTTDESTEVKSFSVEPMLSWKFNPFTVFYLGANIGGQEDPFEHCDGFTPTNRNVYLKFQYLWQAFK